MKPELEEMIQTLREELLHYGEALALLEQQTELITRRAPAELLDNVDAIAAQIHRMALPRARRERLRQQLALELGQPATMSFRELIAFAPPEYRPLLQALIDEINDLLRRSQARLLGNNLLLSRSISSRLPARRWRSSVTLARRGFHQRDLPGCRRRLSLARAPVLPLPPSGR